MTKLKYAIHAYITKYIKFYCVIMTTPNCSVTWRVLCHQWCGLTPCHLRLYSVLLLLSARTGPKRQLQLATVCCILSACVTYTHRNPWILQWSGNSHWNINVSSLHTLTSPVHWQRMYPIIKQLQLIRWNNNTSKSITLFNSKQN